MKYSNWLGIFTALLLIVSAFLPWTYHPDIDQVFTGFYSMENAYGKPGKLLIFFALVASVFFVIPKVWAKRWNILICSIGFAYAIKSFLLFSGCYKGICPDKLYGIWMMTGSALVMLIVSFLPSGKLPSGE